MASSIPKTTYRDKTTACTIQLPVEIGGPLYDAAEAAGITVQAECLKRLAKTVGVKLAPRGRGRPKTDKPEPSAEEKRALAALDKARKRVKELQSAKKPQV